MTHYDSEQDGGMTMTGGGGGYLKVLDIMDMLSNRHT